MSNKHSHPGPHQHNAKDEKRSVSGNVHVRGEVIIEPSPSEAKARDAKDEKEETHKRKIWWLEIATFVVLTIYAGLTAWLAISSQMSANAAAKAVAQAHTQFIQDQRPLVWKTGISYAARNPKAVGRTVVNLSLANYGRSAALHMSVAGKVFCGDEAKTSAYRYVNDIEKQQFWRHGNVVLPPFVPSEVDKSPGTVTITSDPLSDAQIDECIAFKKPVYTIGVIEYFDISGTPYTAEYCMMQGVPNPTLGYSSSGTCPEHNTTQ